MPTTFVAQLVTTPFFPSLVAEQVGHLIRYGSVQASPTAPTAVLNKTWTTYVPVAIASMVPAERHSCQQGRNASKTKTVKIMSAHGRPSKEKDEPRCVVLPTTTSTSTMGRPMESLWTCAPDNRRVPPAEPTTFMFCAALGIALTGSARKPRSHEQGGISNQELLLCGV